MDIRTITPQELAGKQQQGVTIDVIDVRTPLEFREVHCTFALNVPLHDLDPKALFAQRSADQPLYVICKSGGRGKSACERLHAAGFTNVVNVAGGTSAWVEAGLPVVRGKKAISLERQVRIVAGFIVFVSVLLGWFVHPYASGLAAFVGAGLVFAGLTDTCGMGMLLARMPWNRAGRTCTTKAA